MLRETSKVSGPPSCTKTFKTEPYEYKLYLEYRLETKLLSVENRQPILL